MQKHPLFFGLVVRRGGQRARPLRGGEANQQAMPPSARCSCGLTAWPAGHSLIRSRRPSCDGLTTPGMRAPTAMSSRETSARGRQGRVPSPSAPTAAASARRGACCAVGTRAPGTRPAACCRPRSRRPRSAAAGSPGPGRDKATAAAGSPGPDRARHDGAPPPGAPDPGDGEAR